jgi:uncharacterized membrane-anchored protein YhcB (DUF1043 family)
VIDSISARSYNQTESIGNELSEYVAHLQVHMALQSRNLVPHLGDDRNDSRSQLLQETQVDFEKIVSRQ